MDALDSQAERRVVLTPAGEREFAQEGHRCSSRRPRSWF